MQFPIDSNYYYSQLLQGLSFIIIKMYMFALLPVLGFVFKSRKTIHNITKRYSSGFDWNNTVTIIKLCWICAVTFGEVFIFHIAVWNCSWPEISEWVSEYLETGSKERAIR